jgi:hypothetical protein
MPPTVFDKLNLGSRQDLVILDAPASFDATLAALSGVAVHRSLAGVATIDFAVAFVMRPADVDTVAARLLPHAPGDPVIWLAYPKKSSRRYRAELDRDHGWDAMRAAGFDTVRQVAIDDDWSALRFRRTTSIGRRPGR